MSSYNNLPIMPKAAKGSMSQAYHGQIAPYPSMPTSPGSEKRPAAIWSASDDEILLQARASGLNWQPIASKHFPSKSANACRKRHERLIERRQVEDWDAAKLELLAEEYVALRKDMWEILGARLGERWNVVEAKCMEKGLKTLQSIARQAQRKAGRGISDHTSDSGIGMGSDAEMDVEAGPSSQPSFANNDPGAAFADIPPHSRQSSSASSFGRSHDHSRSNSLPLPLPLYQPPPPVLSQRRLAEIPEMSQGGPNMTLDRPFPSSVQRCSPDSVGQRSTVSIQSMLAAVDP